jgi:ATP-dependent RNA helicase RhlE
MAAARTGTGKTAGFALPMIERLLTGKPAGRGQVRSLVLTPTRELAAQVGEAFVQYSHGTALRTTVVFGGVKINPQIERLRQGVDVLVATPGRLLDLHGQQALSFSSLEVLVLDEADRMLDMGFIHDIRRILSLLPERRQNLLFSATFSTEIRSLAKGLINDPVEISVNPANSTAEAVAQRLYVVDKKQKPALLTAIIHDEGWLQALVFTRTKHGANRLARHLEAEGISASAIHGNKSQSARTRALNDFRSGTIRILVATDIAARGLDIDQLPQVVNVDLPNVPEDYVHRIGRTGRAGATGKAISLVAADEAKQLADIEKLIRQQLAREYYPGFEPQHDLPARPPAAAKPVHSKPHKPRTGHRDGQRSGANRNPRGQRTRRARG